MTSCSLGVYRWPDYSDIGMASRLGRHSWRRIVGSGLGLCCSILRTRSLDLPWVELWYQWYRYKWYWYPGRWLGHPQSLHFLFLAFALCWWWVLLVDARVSCYWFLLLLFMRLCLAFFTLPSYDLALVFTSLLRHVYMIFMHCLYFAQHAVDSCSLVCRHHYRVLRGVNRWGDPRGSLTGSGGARVAYRWRRVASFYLAQERFMGLPLDLLLFFYYSLWGLSYYWFLCFSKWSGTLGWSFV